MEKQVEEVLKRFAVSTLSKQDKRQLIDQVLHGEEFRRFIEAPPSERVFHPVALVPLNFSKAMNPQILSNQNVNLVMLLSSETSIKQKKHHPDLPVNYYTLIPRMMKLSEVVKDGRKEKNYDSFHVCFYSAILVETDDSSVPQILTCEQTLAAENDDRLKFLKLSIKSTRNGEEIYFLSFHLVKKKRIVSERDRGTSLRVFFPFTKQPKKKPLRKVKTKTETTPSVADTPVSNVENVENIENVVNVK